MSNSNDMDAEEDSAKLDQEEEADDDSSPHSHRLTTLDAKLPNVDDEGDESPSFSDTESAGDDGEEDEEEEEEEEEDERGRNRNPNNAYDNEQHLSTPETDLPHAHTSRASVDENHKIENHRNVASGTGHNQINSAAAPRSGSAPKLLARAAVDAAAAAGGGGAKTNSASKKLKMAENEDDEESGTKEEQAEFMNEVETFYRERSLEFKAPRFYGEPLNCLKLWNAVIRLGGYDRVTSSKLWRQVGESFHPPKTCTTVSWTFRIFYEKALLEYEKHKRQIGELEFSGANLSESVAIENEVSGSQNTGSGRQRRDAATRAMQGWHAQRLIGFGEVSEPVIKDKNIVVSQKREKQLKSIGVNKLKKPTNMELTGSDLHTESNKQLLTTVVDVGPPADWVKINVRESKDCFEVYALVPGLLREEVRVQSDPGGHIVITGQPEQPENPWGITPFKKIVNLPARINPLQTSAVVSLHGRLFVRVPFERSSS